ncbi:MAG: hypothetical protein Q8O99_06390 [bacterium]|nr:hypothetical protein [bacterium]
MNPLSFPESHKDKSVTPEHALAELLDELTDPLEKFLRELKTVKCNYVYTLPSKNTFEITEEGIVFGRN